MPKPAFTILTISCIFLLIGCKDNKSAEKLADKEHTTLNYGIFSDDLPAFFDCVRENGSLISAHRGGPSSNFPENALETLKNTFNKATPIMEIDISRSKDGVLFMHHDRRLERVTNGRGFVNAQNWRDLSKLHLKDKHARPTPFRLARFDETLRWAKDTGALLQIDRKNMRSFKPILNEIKNQNAENHVIIITYNLDDAQYVASQAPELMISVSLDRKVFNSRLGDTTGLDARKLLAWTGNQSPNKAHIDTLNRLNIETIFGTLGPENKSLDTRYMHDGILDEYQLLIDMGVTLIATDYPKIVADYIESDETALTACGGSK